MIAVLLLFVLGGGLVWGTSFLLRDVHHQSMQADRLRTEPERLTQPRVDLEWGQLDDHQLDRLLRNSAPR